MSRLFCMILILLPVVSVFALPAPMVISTANVIYTVFSESPVDRESVLRFDTLFCAAADDVFSRFNVMAPAQFKVSICYGGWIFKSLTGLDADTAGIYIPSRGMLVFQRPEALAKKGIFTATLRHELLHAAIARAREINGTDVPAAKNNAWLEESLCTAVFPVGEYSVMRGNEILKKIGEKGVRGFIEKGMNSANMGLRRDAYALANVYGNERIKREGEIALFDAVVK